MASIDRHCFLKKLKKSVMSRYGGLTMAQRQDVATLMQRGIDETTARAIVQGYDVRKSAQPTSDYFHAYVRAAKANLPDWQHAMLHRKARGRAGGIGKGRAMLSVEQKKAALFDELQALNGRKKAIHAEIGKMSPLASEVHVSVPLGSDAPRKKPSKHDISIGYVLKAFEESKHPRSSNGRFGSGGGGGSSKGPDHTESNRHFRAAASHRDDANKAHRRGDAKGAKFHEDKAKEHTQSGHSAHRVELDAHMRGLNARVASASFDRLSGVKKAIVGFNDKQMAYIQAAYAGQVPNVARTADEPNVIPSNLTLEANRLVQGMDAELQSGAATAEDARRRASRMLRDKPGIYDQVGAPQPVRDLRGLMVDVGPGPNRARGYLGLDLKAYDHGTVLHDVSSGLPFDDGSVRALRFGNSLHDILDSDGPDANPVPLLMECQRVLMEGGRLEYVGPEPLWESDVQWPLPGLVLEQGGSRDPVFRDGLVHQQFRRVPMRVGAYHGADSDYFAAPQAPVSDMMATWAINEARASRAMANLVHKQDERGTRVVKADAMRQILTCVVLSPVGVDTQGDVMTAHEIELAAHNYLKTSRIVGADHGRPIDASVVESYIAPQDMDYITPAGRSHVHKGDWVISIYVADPESWASVINGDFEGVSVGGIGEREEASAS